MITITFTALVITGFSLSYPDSLFSTTVKNLLGLGEGTRSVVHRIAGVGLALTFLWHFLSILLTKRGRQELKALWIQWQDIKDVFLNVFYHLGLRKKAPSFDRYDYSEKMEYWALIWGTFVMVCTGLMMWFPVLAAKFGLGKIWVDVSKVIHFYEAWLATLAILIWHFFFVIFHPEEYPMSLSWITGKLSLKTMKHHHPEELKKLIETGEVHNLQPGEEEKLRKELGMDDKK